MTNKLHLYTRETWLNSSHSVNLFFKHLMDISSQQICSSQSCIFSGVKPFLLGHQRPCHTRDTDNPDCVYPWYELARPTSMYTVCHTENICSSSDKCNRVCLCNADLVANCISQEAHLNFLAVCVQTWSSILCSITAVNEQTVQLKALALWITFIWLIQLWSVWKFLSQSQQV